MINQIFKQFMFKNLTEKPQFRLFAAKFFFEDDEIQKS